MLVVYATHCSMIVIHSPLNSYYISLYNLCMVHLNITQYFGSDLLLSILIIVRQVKLLVERLMGMWNIRYKFQLQQLNVQSLKRDA